LVSPRITGFPAAGPLLLFRTPAIPSSASPSVAGRAFSSSSSLAMPTGWGEFMALVASAEAEIWIAGSSMNVALRDTSSVTFPPLTVTRRSTGW
jgi:hypothetical protein